MHLSGGQLAKFSWDDEFQVVDDGGVVYFKKRVLYRNHHPGHWARTSRDEIEKCKYVWFIFVGTDTGFAVFLSELI